MRPRVSAADIFSCGSVSAVKVRFVDLGGGGGGAGRAAWRTLEAVSGIGVHADMVSATKAIDDPRIHVVDGRVDRIGWAARQLARRAVRRIGYRPAGVLRSFNLLPSGMRRHILRGDPDVVHLHWFGYEWLDLWTLPRLRRPTVWTLHDTWAVNGAAHYVVEGVADGHRGGFLRQRGADAKRMNLDAAVYRAKVAAFRQWPVQIVSPSHWLADLAREADCFPAAEVSVIPNPLDTTVFQPAADRTALRARLGLPPEAFLLLTGAQGLSDPRKGVRFIGPALDAALAQLSDRLQAPLVLVAFGDDGGGAPIHPHVETRFTGFISDDGILADYYAAADAMIVPSMYENFPSTATEALASGTPVLGFATSGMPSTVRHGRDGLLAPCYDTDALGRFIAQLYENPRMRREFGANGRNWAVETLSPLRVGEQYRAVYEQALKRGVQSSGSAGRRA